MAVSLRLGAPAGLGRAGALALLVAASAGAAPWHRSYERAQQLLVEGDAAAAEAALQEAIADRPRSGCRLRTYGVRVRDYLPWYYLGLALEEQGRGPEARQAFDRAQAEGVISSCPGTRLQALDLLDRLDRFDEGETIAPVADAQAVAELKEAALAAGAERHARTQWRAAVELEESCPACGETAAAFLVALSRARVTGPLAGLVESSAREAMRELEMEVRRRAVVDTRRIDELAALRREASAAHRVREWIAVERRAVELRAALQRPPEPSPDGKRSLSVRELLLERVKAAAAAARSLPPEVPRSAEQARELSSLMGRLRSLDAVARLRGKPPADGAELLQEAEALRERLVRMARGEASAPAIEPARIELVWSTGARVARRPLLGEPEP